MKNDSNKGLPKKAIISKKDVIPKKPSAKKGLKKKTASKAIYKTKKKANGQQALDGSVSLAGKEEPKVASNVEKLKVEDPKLFLPKKRPLLPEEKTRAKKGITIAEATERFRVVKVHSTTESVIVEARNKTEAVSLANDLESGHWTLEAHVETSTDAISLTNISIENALANSVIASNPKTVELWLKLSNLTLGKLKSIAFIYNMDADIQQPLQQKAMEVFGKNESEQLMKEIMTTFHSSGVPALSKKHLYEAIFGATVCLLKPEGFRAREVQALLLPVKASGLKFDLIG